MKSALPSQQEKKKPSGYLPTLDGWRAVAILSVLWSHDVPWNVPGGPPMHFQSLGGIFGVRLFFAISGFLITTRILEEEQLVGRFDLRRFYVRRVCRIQPAAWAYLAAVALVMLLGMYPARWKEWLGALFLYLNFLVHSTTPSSLVGHFWTLSVEEHFYLLLSLALFTIRKRRLLFVSVTYLILVVVARSHYPYDHGWWDPVSTWAQTQWQIYMLWMAALLAILMRREAIAAAVKRHLHPWVAIGIALVAVLAHNFGSEMLDHSPLHLRYIAQQVDFVSSYFFAPIVISTVYHPRSLLSRLLELKWIRFIGRISYSLYLWHVLFFFRPEDVGGTTARFAPWIRLVTGWPQRYLFAFGAAVLSYYFIEKPLIRFGHRLAPPATPGRSELADLPVEEPLPQRS